MKKTILSTAILSTGVLSLLSGVAQADVSDQVTNVANSEQVASASEQQERVIPTTQEPISLTLTPSSRETAQGPETTHHPVELAQNGALPIQQPITVATAANPPAPTTAPAPTSAPVKEAPPAATPLPNASAPATATPPVPAEVKPAAPAPVIDCNYHIPPETAHIEKTVILQWTEKATQQSFDFDHVNMPQQLTALKACYTDQGWESFNDALQKSGNMNAIQSQKLVVSSMIQGEPSISEVKDNQWKVSLPMQVVYQNEKEKLTQALTVDLIVGRKISGDLGIMQMIASPRQANAKVATDAAPAPTP